MNELQDTIRECIVAPQHFAGPAVKHIALRVRDMLANRVTRIAIDFTTTELIDSSGIGMLVSLMKECRSQKCSLILCNLTYVVLELFEDTGLDKIFTIEKDGDVKIAEIDLFERGVDIRLDMKQVEVNESVCIYQLSGVMNYPFGSRYFKQQILLALSKYKTIVLDFGELTFFDSLSVSALVNMCKLLHDTGGCLRVCCLNYIVEDMFSTLGLKRVVPVYESCEDACAGRNRWE
jgi:anti-anti-sigma factor